MTQFTLVEAHDLIDAHHISDGLWQGAVPTPGNIIRDAGFHLLVLCASEYQLPAEDFPGVEVIHAPNEDDDSRPPTREELKIAVQAAERVVEALQAGKKVLVTCWAGRNRSGLVSALALRKHLGLSGLKVITLVQMCRPRALTNTQFEECLARLPAIPRQSSSARR